MDWYSWLSKSALHPSLVYDYSLLFADNELGENDIPHFNHEFLLSMGISIAKHRLEIVKLAKRNKKIKKRILNVVTNTKKRLSSYLRAIGGPVGKSDGRLSAIVVMPTEKPSVIMRLPSLRKHGRLMITGGSVSHSVSPMVYGVEEEMRWDSMFQDLKPT